jgi:hypothetical protein
MAAVALHRDVISQVLTFCETPQDCARAMRVSRAWVAAARFGGFPSISSIKLESNQLMGFAKVSWKLPRLVRLYIDWTLTGQPIPHTFDRPGMTELSITNRSFMSTEMFEALIEAMQEVRRLCYVDDDQFKYGMRVRDRLAPSTRAKFANLVEVVISGQNFEARPILDILCSSTSIERAQLPCEVFTDGRVGTNIFRELAKQTKMRELGTVGTTSNFSFEVDYQTEWRAPLRKLIYGGGGVTGLGVILGVNRNTLREFDLTALVHPMFWYATHIEGAIDLPHLEKFRLPCIGLNEMVILKDGLPSLRELEFPEGVVAATGVPSEEWDPFVQAFPALTSLKIYGLKQTTEAFLVAISKLAQLKVLELRNCFELLPEHGRPLGSLKQLQRLTLEGGLNTNQDVVMHIVKNCPQLVTFEVNYEHPGTLYQIAALIQQGVSQIRYFGRIESYHDEVREYLQRYFPTVQLDPVPQE